MMRKLDSFIIKSFLGPFILTTLVATFVLLIQYMMKYFDDFVGKNLGFQVFAELIFYFSLNMLQSALPLGILVSSLMTFGNLGEHFELTAIKSAGISLIRALRPIFFFVILLTFGAFEFNNYVVPSANLKAYSLLYDIKHKKPALDIKEGVFYNGIPKYSIKAREKFPDNKTLKDVLIYDHNSGKGNNRVILADSARMYMILNDRYLKLELYDGNYYSEEPKSGSKVDDFYRTKYDRMDMVFDLSSFTMNETDDELFRNNRQMKNVAELTYDIDSMEYEVDDARVSFFVNEKGFFSYHMKDMQLEIEKLQKEREEEKEKIRKDSSKQPLEKEDFVEKGEVKASVWPFGELLDQQTPRKKAQMKKKGPMMKKLPEKSKTAEAEEPEEEEAVNEKAAEDERHAVSAGESAAKMKKDSDSLAVKKMEALEKHKKGKEEPLLVDTLSWAYLDKTIGVRKQDVLLTAKTQAQNIKNNLMSTTSRIDNLNRDINKFVIEKYKKYSMAFACVVMFLIGAPLGAIIKKGGLGVPVIVSIIFFLIYYVINIVNEKWAKEGLMDPILAVWIADLLLLPVGLFCLRQARIDARLFEVDFYNIWIDKIKGRFLKR